MNDATPTDASLVERAQRFATRHPRAVWPHHWKLAALREVSRLSDEVEQLRSTIARLRAASVVLDAITLELELEDPDRPEESPVDAIRRLKSTGRTP